VKSYGALLGVGLILIAGAAWVGGRGGLIGGGVALAAQLAAVGLLRPGMDAPQPAFLARWFAGMGIRVLALGGMVAVAATHRDALPLVATTLGFLGVLLPLLFLEIRFLT
jgi:hypothetical protein